MQSLCTSDVKVLIKEGIKLSPYEKWSFLPTKLEYGGQKSKSKTENGKAKTEKQKTENENGKWKNGKGKMNLSGVFVGSWPAVSFKLCKATFRNGWEQWTTFKGVTLATKDLAKFPLILGCSQHHLHLNHHCSRHLIPLSLCISFYISTSNATSSAPKERTEVHSVKLLPCTTVLRQFVSGSSFLFPYLLLYFVIWSFL